MRVFASVLVCTAAAAASLAAQNCPPRGALLEVHPAGYTNTRMPVVIRVHGRPGRPYVLMLDTQANPRRLPPFECVYLALTPAFRVVVQQTMPASGTATLRLRIPDGHPLVGTTAYFQAGAHVPMTNAFDLSNGASLTVRKTPFVVFDNTGYRDKPDLGVYGLRKISLKFTGNNEARWKGTIRRRWLEMPGAPIVIDIEKGALHSPSGLAKVTRWTKEAVPQVVVGHYTPGKRLIPFSSLVKHVDAFFPSFYVFKATRSAAKNWKRDAAQRIRQAKAHGKPIYLYIWPRLHGGGPYYRSSFFRMQLDAAYRLGADGVVIWGGKGQKWKDNAGWWKVTKSFMAKIHEGILPR